jgi:3-oxoacyl-[acyl-carrier protein] reductase
MTGSLIGKVAWVTGASRGIGKAIARTLAEAGAHTVGTARDLVKLQAAMSEIAAGESKTVALAMDVARADEVNRVAEEILRTFGRIDILVNNAGITRDNLLVRMREEEWDEVIQTNLTGSYYCTRAVIRTMMKQRSGRVINISSVVGAMGNAGQANYAASKAALVGFTKSVAREYANRGITVNAVAPGFIETDMTDGMSKESQSALIAQIPMGRFGSPNDVANVVRFLVTDEAAYLTGQVIHVNGGMWM